jgi:O-antigen/teichoic acid export membrane protein
MKDRLLDDALVYTIANLASRGALVISLLVLPHLLTQAQYGALGIIVAIAAFVNIIVPLEVTQGLIRYYPSSEQQEQMRLVGTAWLFTLAMLALAAGSTLLAAEPISRFIFGSDEFVNSFRFAVIFFVANTILYFLQNQCRWEFRVAAYVWISVGYAAASLGLSILLAIFAKDALLGALAGQTLGGCVVLLIGAWRLRAILFHRPHPDALRKMLAFSIPLVPAGIAFNAGVYASRMFVNDLANLDLVGIYTFASQIATMPALSIIGIQAALQPLIMASHAKPDTPAIIARLFEGFVGMAGVICAAFGMMAEPLIRLVGNPDYLPAAPLVMILAPAFLTLQIYIFAPGFAIAERTRTQMTITIVGTSLGAALSYVWTGAYGITGAAWSTLAGAVLFIALWFMLSQRLYPVPIRWRRVAAFLGCWVAIAAIDRSLPSMSIVTAIVMKLGLLAAMAVSVPALGLISLDAARAALTTLGKRFRHASR